MGKSKRRQRQPASASSGTWRPVLVPKGLVKPGQPLVIGNRLIIHRDDYLEGQFHAARILLQLLENEAS